MGVSEGSSPRTSGGDAGNAVVKAAGNVVVNNAGNDAVNAAGNVEVNVVVKAAGNDGVEARRRRSLGYLPGVDGIRALAIIVVLAFHAGLPGGRGGFLGVDIFFVISGFLITLLLIHEFRTTRAVSFRSFWSRRAKRLLPALFALLIVTAVLLLTVQRRTAISERGDIAAALTYVTNWYQLNIKRSYFAGFGRPPLLRHLWSLAVEEQFYLAWPIVMFGFLRFTKKKKTMTRAFVGLSLASTVLMAALYQRFVVGSRVPDISSVYLRTDTRAAGLLVGAAAGSFFYRVLAGARSRSVLWGERARFGSITDSDIVGMVGLFVTLGCVLLANEGSAWLFRGGFLLVSVGTAAMLIGCTHPRRWLWRRERMSAFLPTFVAKWSPLRWLGQRSYGIYLWHWPIFLFMRPAEDLPRFPSWLVQFGRVGAALLAAEVSYRTIERPFRSSSVVPAFQSESVGGDSKTPPEKEVGQRLPKLWARPSVLALSSLMVGASLAAGLTNAKPTVDPLEATLKANAAELARQQQRLAAGITEPNTVANEVSTTVSGSTASADSSPPSTLPAATTTTMIPWVPLDIRGLSVGDSVQLGAALELQKRFKDQFHIDAETNRQFMAGLDIASTEELSDDVGDVLVIHLGNNGGLDVGVLDNVLKRFDTVPLVVLVNLHVGSRGYVEAINRELVAQTKKHSNVVVADWRSIALANRNALYDDDTHVRPDRAGIYGDLIADTIARECSLEGERRGLPSTLTGETTSTTTTTTSTTTTTLLSTSTTTVAVGDGGDVSDTQQVGLTLDLAGDVGTASASMDPIGPVVYRFALACVRPTKN